MVVGFATTLYSHLHPGSSVRMVAACCPVFLDVAYCALPPVTSCPDLQTLTNIRMLISHFKYQNRLLYLSGDWRGTHYHFSMCFLRDLRFRLSVGNVSSPRPAYIMDFSIMFCWPFLAFVDDGTPWQRR
ncbi:uncharacterized protein LACBIDRAFT_308101 [Laccaria bicolor S238N-H82]|uniref:Predicted protein n=1 Tax=Laccaria bicolor (strain S238N-H82 / ATCC MYA-4686) TaxID=486041 RepID=B0DRN0_LACBS|nr:uncharacterized protein LACBIDRAFT_308101 [Laccaria bicolor S238N-H82]EDR02812.1 predicted protein [Laccaria bicolor S238N-H82]|eukprot:XP_001886522.1 predicted protein [Laccaria bicolor S238N-H82]